MTPCSCGAHRWFINRAWSFEKHLETYYVICKSCGRTGTSALSEKEAIEEWNRIMPPQG